MSDTKRAVVDGDGAVDTTIPTGWFESRTGLRSALRTAIDPLVPASARLRYALGASLVAAVVIELFTGVLLMLSFSPSSTTAWASAFYIDNVLTCGWFLRGLHSFAAHGMIVVALLHLLSVVISGVYRAPREWNWWLGLILLFLVVVLTITGNAVVWDQDGYWAWNVETSIAGSAPVIGPWVQRLVVGGSELGNATLGRLYALHVVILPFLVLLTFRAHIRLARKHALTRPEAQPGNVEPAWPKQVFANLLASALFLGIVSLLVVLNRGVALDAPADPASEYPARPAWFVFWLFELRKHFLGPREVIATMVIPSAIAGVLVFLPFLDRLFPRKFAHFLATSFVFAILGGASYLTVLAFQADAADTHYRESLAKSNAARDRAVALARPGIPPEGGAALLVQDPLWHGRAVLDAKCLVCHAYDGKAADQQTAPDLKDFGSRAWIRGLLENPQAKAYFGKSPALDGMVAWKKASKLSKQQLDDVADFVASFAAIPDDMTPEEWQNLPGVSTHPGLEPFTKECGTCHVVPGLTEGGDRDSPQLFGWGSPRWTTRMIRKPGAGDMYGYLEKEHVMPSFADQLTDNDLGTILRYLRNDYLGASRDRGQTLKTETKLTGLLSPAVTRVPKYRVENASRDEMGSQRRGRIRTS